MGVFSFWELSFSGIFIKLSKEWNPPVWLVPSSNVSFLILLCLFSFFIFFSFTQSYLFSLTQSSLSLFCVALEREQDQTLRSEALPVTVDSRNDVELSPGRIVRHTDLKIVRQVDRSSIFWLRFLFFYSALLFFFFWLWVSCAFFWIFCVALGGVDGSGIWVCCWWWWWN